MILSRGIDVSHHQGSINWPAITRELGLTWGACKATEGTGFRDAQFTSNWAGMKQAGLVRVAYHFGRPDTSASAQARFFLSVVQPVDGDVLCLDLETADGKDQAEVNAWAKAFSAAVRSGAPKNTLLIYLGGYSANGTGHGLSDHYDYWWYPRYATMQPVSTWPASYAPRLSGNTTGWGAPHVWQWACSLRTSQGQVDANISTLSAAQLRDGPRPAAVQEDDMPTTDEIAHDVLAYEYKGRQVLSYIVTADTNARNAARDAAESLAIVKAMAAKGGALTSDEVKAAVEQALDEKIDSVDAQVNLHVDGAA